MQKLIIVFAAVSVTSAFLFPPGGLCGCVSPVGPPPCICGEGGCRCLPPPPLIPCPCGGLPPLPPPYLGGRARRYAPSPSPGPIGGGSYAGAVSARGAYAERK